MTIAATNTTISQLMWMPGCDDSCSATPMWMLALLKKPEASQPIVYAPIAKKAT